MSEFNFGIVANIVLAGLAVSIIVAMVGMILWFIKVKPDFEVIKSDLAKKAAAAEVVRINLDLEQKREEALRIKTEIDRKQNIGDCDLLRKGCQPLFLEKIGGLLEKVDDLKKGQEWIIDRIQNGK